MIKGLLSVSQSETTVLATVFRHRFRIVLFKTIGGRGAAAALPERAAAPRLNPRTSDARIAFRRPCNGVRPHALVMVSEDAASPKRQKTEEEEPRPAMPSEKLASLTNTTPRALSSVGEAGGLAADDGSKRPTQPIRTTEAAPITNNDEVREGEITLRRCLYLLQHGDPDLTERPAHLMERSIPTQLFAETPKQKRTVNRWGGQTGRPDRWANSGGVSGAHDYFPDGQKPGAFGVRKRYGRVTRPQLPLLKFFEFTMVHVEEDNTVVESKDTVLFQVFTPICRVAPGKRHWETQASRDGTMVPSPRSPEPQIPPPHATHAGAFGHSTEATQNNMAHLEQLRQNGLLSSSVFREGYTQADKLRDPSANAGAQQASPRKDARERRGWDEAEVTRLVELVASYGQQWNRWCVSFPLIASQC